jgi:hypothetical protein
MTGDQWALHRHRWWRRTLQLMDTAPSASPTHTPDQLSSLSAETETQTAEVAIGSRGRGGTAASSSALKGESHTTHCSKYMI